jgi:hypothetical protein
MEVDPTTKEPLEIGQRYKISWPMFEETCTCTFEKAGIYIFRRDNGSGFMIGVGTKNGKKLFFPAMENEFGTIDFTLEMPLHLFKDEPAMYESGMLKGGTKSRRKTKKRRRAYGSKSHRNRARISSRR